MKEEITTQLVTLTFAVTTDIDPQTFKAEISKLVMKERTDVRATFIRSSHFDKA